MSKRSRRPSQPNNGSTGVNPEQLRSMIQDAVAEQLQGMQGEAPSDPVWDGHTVAPRRRMDPVQSAQKSGRGSLRPIPDYATGAAQQAAHAQALTYASQQANQRKPVGGNQQNRPGGMLGNRQGKTIQGLGLTWDPNVDQQTYETMLENEAPQDDPSYAMSPAAPILPYGPEPAAGPRQFEYPVGYNLGRGPRAHALTSNAQLRALAFNYEGIQLCERVYFDILSRLELRVSFKEGIIPDGESQQDPKWQKIIAPAEKFLQYPDGIHPLDVWMTGSVRDLLEIGQSPIYKRLTLDGTLCGLDLVDGATIKPLIDERGRQPLPPYPAWQQWVYGIPYGWYRADQIYMMTETMRSDDAFPMSRVEAIVLRINQALRKENLDLMRYTSGSLPEGIIFPDVELQWTPEQVEDYEQRFNGLLSGNDGQRVRVKFAPPGSTFQATRPDDPDMAFDTFLLTITAAAFGLSMDELSFAANSTMAYSKSQQSVMMRRVMDPTMLRYARFFTEIIQSLFDPRLIVSWAGLEEEDDQQAKATALSTGVKIGALSPSRMAKMMGWPIDVETEPFIIAGNQVQFLSDLNALRTDQLAAQQAGLQFAAQNPAAKAMAGKPGAEGSSSEGGEGEPGAEGDAGGDASTKSGSVGTSNKNAPGKGAKAGAEPAGASKSGSGNGASNASAGTKKQTQTESADDAKATVGGGVKQAGKAAGKKAKRADPEAILRELRQWKTAAQLDMKRRGHVQRFQHDALQDEPEMRIWLTRELARAISASDVSTAFAEAARIWPIERRKAPEPVRHLSVAEQHTYHVPPAHYRQTSHDLSLSAQHIFDQIAARGHHSLIAERE